jgi:hypothetical protein
MRKKRLSLSLSASCGGISMIEISLFVEDFGHEEFLTALTERLAAEAGTGVRIRPRSVRGGRGKVLTEVGQYIVDIEKGREPMPDLLVVATDANCQGYTSRKKEIEKVAASLIQRFPEKLLVAIPDPHVERWMLVDSQAFKAVLGRGCNAPDLKCERERYKHMLLTSMRAAGIVPPLGGMEYARDIVKHLDLQRAGKLDVSLGLAIASLRSGLKSPP